LADRHTKLKPFLFQPSCSSNQSFYLTIRQESPPFGLLICQKSAPFRLFVRQKSGFSLFRAENKLSPQES